MISNKGVKKEAIRWLSKHSQKKAFKREEINNEYILKFLLNNELIYRLNRNFYLIKKQEDNPADIFNLAYWEIVKMAIEPYKPYSIKGYSALNIYIGDQSAQNELTIRSAKKISHILDVGFGKKIKIIYDPNFNKNLTDNIKITGINFTIDKAEKIILEKIKKNKNYFLFLQSYNFNIRLLELLYDEKPKPIIFKHLIFDFRKANRDELSQKIKQIIEKLTLYRVALGKQKNIKISKPAKKIYPWVLRQSEQILKFEAEIYKKYKNIFKKIKKSKFDILQKKAIEHKKYDIYNSTTIEGYNITPEEVEEVLLQPKTIIKKKDKERLRNKMAILGYHQAFNYALSEAKNNFNNNSVSEELIKNIYFYLFKPSVDAKIIDRYDLLSYRKIQVYIRGSNYIPPASEKILDLTQNFEYIVNHIKNPIVKAILAHYLLVTIHPFADGNGRTARLLMNYIFLSSGFNWITIIAEERIKYFKALEAGQVKNDIFPFADLIIKKLYNKKNLG